MSRRGENIYKRKDNRWEGRYIRGRGATGKIAWGYVYAGSYREVREKLLLAKQQKQQVISNRETFGFFCEEWLTLSRNRVKDATFAKYHNVVTRYLKPRLGFYAPQDMSTVLIEEFSHTLLSEGLSPKTVRDILCVVKSVLKHCHKRIETFFPDIEIIYPKETKQAMRVLSSDEQDVLVRYLITNMDSVKFGVLMALFTGMRIGELCALKWKNISISNGTLTIHETMQRLPETSLNAVTKTKVVVNETKSYASTRVIPLTETAIALCEKMKKSDENGYVLTGEEKRFMEPRALQYRFAKYVGECGLVGVHFHTLRHTFATRCVEVGFEIKSLSEILGHASTKITLDRYVHSSMDLKRANMKKLSAVGF